MWEAFAHQESGPEGTVLAHGAQMIMTPSRWHWDLSRRVRRQLLLAAWTTHMINPHLPASIKSRHLTGAAGIAVSLVTISVLHYVTSFNSIVWHEVFKRLYYVPIVSAAVTAGTRGGLAASIVATLLYLPHVALGWHAWAVIDVDQYGEMLMFNVVAIVTGALVDRLRAERDRCRLTATELRQAYASLEAQTDERLRVDRLVNIGRIASGIAHEIRTPLAGLLGCVEILGAEFPRAHPKIEFLDIAKREIARLQRVVTEFLEFAHPAPPTVQAVDSRLLAETAARLARPALIRRDVDLVVRAPEAAVSVHVDAEQVQRALLSILLACSPSLRNGRLVLTIYQAGDIGRLTVEFEGITSQSTAWDVFEPFPTTANGDGLALATARRLIENQHGTVQAEFVHGRLRCVVNLPIAEATPGETTVLARAAGEAIRSC